MTAGSHTESWAAHNLRNTEHLSKAGFLPSVATGSFPSEICHFLQKIFGIMFFYGSDSQQWCCFQRVDWNHQQCVTSDITITIKWLLTMWPILDLTNDRTDHVEQQSREKPIPSHWVAPFFWRHTFLLITFIILSFLITLLPLLFYRVHNSNPVTRVSDGMGGRLNLIL